MAGLAWYLSALDLEELHLELSNSLASLEDPSPTITMNLTVPAIVFIVTNLWGLFAGIPFTAIQRSRPLLDRAVGCLQLASTAYTLERIQPYLTPTRVTWIPGATENITAQKIRQELYGIRRMNATVEPVSKAAVVTRVSRELNSSPTGWPVPDTVDFSALLSIWSARFSEWLALMSEWLTEWLLPLSTEPPKPEAPQDTSQDNLVPVLLVVILSILVRQALQQPDAVRETAILHEQARGVKEGLKRLENSIDWLVDGYNQWMMSEREQQQKDLKEARRHIDRIERGITRLLRLGAGLSDLRAELINSRRDFRIARDSIHNTFGASADALMRAADTIRAIQSSLSQDHQDLRENMDLMTDVRWALVQSLLQYPGALCDQLVTAVATMISEQSNGAPTTDITNAASSSESVDDGVAS